MLPPVPHAAGPPPAAAGLTFLPPPPELAPAVEYLWQLELAPAAAEGAFWRVVADGYIDVVVRLALTPDVVTAANAAAEGSLVARRVLADALVACPPVACGAAATARVLPMVAPLLVTGVRFRLGAAAGALHAAPADLVDGAHPLGAVLDARAAAGVAGALADGVHGSARALLAAGRPAGDALADRWGAPLGDWREDPLGDPAAGAAGDGRLRALARAAACAVAGRLVARAAPHGARQADPRVRGALHLLDRGHAADLAAGAAAAAGGPGGAAPDALADRGAARVGEVARALGLSPRTLERLFAEHVGFAPRTYQRLRRVGAVARALEPHAPEPRADGPPAGAASRAVRRAPASLSELAHGLGYADHAHMTREFGRVMGVAPSAYAREARAVPVARRVGAVAFERPLPLGTVALSSVALSSVALGATG